MIRRPPRSTRTDTLFPYTTLFRSKLSRRDPTSLPENLPRKHIVPAMDNFRLPAARGHKRTPVSIDVTVNGILNLVDGRIPDLSEGGARIDGASMPARPRCEIPRSKERLVGKECVSTFRSRWSTN